MFPSYRPLLDALQARGVDALLLQEAADEADRSNRSIRDVLINDSVVTEMELTEASADAHGVNSVDLVGYPLDVTAMAKIPLALVIRHRVLGIGFSGDSLIVAVSDPSDVVAMDDIRAASGMNIVPVVAARSELRKLIDRLKREETDLGDVAASFTQEDTQMSAVQAEEDDAPVVRYVNSLIEQAIQSRASDLHLEPTEDDLRVRFRIDGVLHEIDRVPFAVQSPLISRLKIMASVDITEKRVPQNGRITVRLDRHKVDLRLATLPTVWGEKVVLRVLDTGGIDLELRKLGFTDTSYDRFSALVHQAARHGAGDRADRFGQVDHAVRDAGRDQQARGQHHHRGGPGRVPAGRRQPGAGEPQGRPHVRRGASGHPAVGPRRRAHRRDPGPDDGAARRRGRPHRPPRALDPAHQRRPVGHHPAHRDGHRAVPGRLLDGLRAGPAAVAPAV